jgi:hypothetical protein
VASAGESSGAPELAARRVTAAEAGDVVELFTLAFHEDPTWSWAFPNPEARLEHHRGWWSLFMHTAVPYGWVWMTEDGGAASSWIPPGRPELSEEDEAQVEPLLRRLVGAHADDVLTLLDRFDSNHPSAEPHFFLSLLGTHPDHRGQGKGMASSPRISRESTGWACRPTSTRATAPMITATNGSASSRLESSRFQAVNPRSPACGATHAEAQTGSGGEETAAFDDAEAKPSFAVAPPS